MPRERRIYFQGQNQPSDQAPGDLLVNPSNNSVQYWTGSAWASVTFGSIVLTDAASKIVPGATSLAFRNNADSQNNLIITDAGAATFIGAITTTSVTPTAGFASTNAATPGWYIPGAAGVPTGAVASLAGRAAVYYDTTNNRIWCRFGGSWFATPSLILGG